MGKIDSFSIERFQMSLKTLVTFCKGGSSNKYYDIVFNPSNSKDVKHSIYKGAFVESVEYLYGFIPEVFREYCKQFSIEVHSKDGTPKTIGYLDLFNSMYSEGKVDLECLTLLKNVYSNRGHIIHRTLITKDKYYQKLFWIASKIDEYDLDSLYKYVVGLCKEINTSYDKGVRGRLVVKERVKPNKELLGSRVW